jgi:ribulose 1,5-bisphosphate carboxylase large subunit-like protein
LLGAKLVVQRPGGKTLVLPLGRVYGTRALREMEDALTVGINAPKPEPKKARKKKRQQP